MKKNRGIAIKRIQEFIKQGKPIVMQVTVSKSFVRARDKAIEKLLNDDSVDTIKLEGAFSDFSVTLNMPEKDKLIEVIEKDGRRIYLTGSIS